MENIQHTEYIHSTLQQKGFNRETISYILQYLEMNQELFGNILDIDKVSERILNNLKGNITNFDKKENLLMRLAKLTIVRGVWEPNKGKISINPISKIMEFFSEKELMRNISTIMHETDHCATTKYIDVS